MTRELLFIEKISVQADTFYEDAERCGAWAAEAFGGRHRAQLTSLENIANSTRKVSDVKDYIKKQTARDDKRETWRHTKNGQWFGPTLLKFVEEDLSRKTQEVCSSVEAGTQASASALEKQQTHLALIREFVRQVVAHYEYSALQGGVLDT